MKKEFIPYKQALALKELGFDEPCVAAYFNQTKEITLSWYPKCIVVTREENYVCKNSSRLLCKCTAPLYQQAFRWFREKHGLYYHIVPEFYTKGINFNWQILWYLPKEEWTKHVISDGTGLYGDNGEYPTQEEAEQACLDKLIEIVKQPKS